MDISQKILEIADSLFHKYGIRSISMDEIARELSISKKTIYQYFKDKDDIVYQVTVRNIKLDKEEFEEVFQSSKDAIDELLKISQCIRVKLKEINPSLLFDINKYHPRSWELWIEYKNHFMKNHIFRSIERGIKEGFFRNDLNAEVLAKLRIEQVEMSFDERVFPRTEFNFLEVQMALFDHFVHGLLTVKGQEIYENLTKSSVNV